MIPDFDPVEAADHCLHPELRFNDLDPGDRFRFPGMTIHLYKTKSGYRRTDPVTLVPVGPVWKTGARTAVIPLDLENPNATIGATPPQDSQ